MSRLRQPRNLAVLAFAALALVVGWRVFWFMTDDAYIAFRYAYNHIQGHGYVWNPDPFLPVEGYTSFLWLVVMEWVWRITGVEPPVAANHVSLLFSLGSLVVVWRMLLGLDWREDAPVTTWLALALLFVLSNRTFLAWTSSGLETAMFNFFVLAWIERSLFGDSAADAWLPSVAGLASLVYLTRPDGLLLIGATLALASLLFAGRPEQWRGLIVQLLPLAAVPLHMLWRRSFYGEWLPNTYYAKHSGAWPESGLRYVSSFVLEYALFVWLALLLALALARLWPRPGSGARKSGLSRGLVAFTAEHQPSLRRLVVIGTVVAHLGYYTLVIGGDHFEYRVYSYLVPLIAVSFVYALNRAHWSVAFCTTLLMLQIVLSWPIPWLHWRLSQAHVTRSETSSMWIPMAGYFPRAFFDYVNTFDRLQQWLTWHYVGLRHQEHKVVGLWWIEQSLPPRGAGLRMSSEGLPVFFGAGGIGGLGWVLPNVNVIDGFGLNDYVVARHRGDGRPVRRMAHERKAPAGYAECFRPNVVARETGGFEVVPRQRPLLAEDVRACERTWRARVAEPRPYSKGQS